MKSFKCKKKYIMLGIPALLLIVVLIAFWRSMCSGTDVAFVNYQVITLGEISKANDNSFIRLHEAQLDDIDEWDDYDVVLINGMGLRITDEQRTRIQEMTDQGLKVLTTAATNPANNIVSVDEWDADSLKQYLSAGGRRNYRNFLNYLRNEVDGKLFFLKDVEPVEERNEPLLYHPNLKDANGEELGFASIKDYNVFLTENNLHKADAPRIIISGMMGDATDLISAL